MNIPIVSLDKVYITTDEKNIFFLDCTRVDQSNDIISRKKEPLDKQIQRLSLSINTKEIIIADDVIFTGSVLKKIINKFNAYGIQVVGVISSICSEEAYYYFNNILKYGVQTTYLMSNNVIDQVCERDFYFGIAGSGIMINTPKGLYKAPYFKPYGNPRQRASIPIENERYFSKGCIERSIYLWESIEKQKPSPTLMYQLPEKIIYTEENEEVIRVLRKDRKKL